MQGMVCFSLVHSQKLHETLVALLYVHSASSCNSLIEHVSVLL